MSKDRLGNKCPVPFARNSPFGCSAQKVPDTYFPLIAKQKMREYRDASDRFCIDLSDRDEDFEAFASRMTSLHGSPVEKVNGVDQHYWDFDVNGITVVLHSDGMAGVSIHAKDGAHENLVREIAKQLTE